MRITFLIPSGVFAACLCGVAALAGTHPATFVFAPVDGDHYWENSHREVVTEMDGSTRSQDFDVMDTKTEVSWKKVAESVQMTRTARSLTDTDNGKPLENPSLPLILNRTTTNVFSKDGTFLRLEGNENLIADAERIFPEQLHASLEAAFEPATLEAGERRLWETADCGSLLGHEMTENARWELHVPVPVQNKPLTMNLISRVVAVKRVKGRSEVTVMSFGSTDATLLKPVDHPGIVDVQDSAVREFVTWNVTDLPLEKVVSRITVDAQTLELIQREKITVDVGNTPEGLETRTEDETITRKPADSR